MVSRLCRPAHAGFDGSGGLYRAGRWHNRGHRVIYTSDSEALAALEVLVHLSSPAQMPDYLCVKARIAERFIADIRDFGLLPADWASAEPKHARGLATNWILEKASVALRAPSVVIPRESNYMLNPAHSDFASVTVDPPQPFEFDVRIKDRLH